jgi:hypothetical protein
MRHLFFCIVACGTRLSELFRLDWKPRKGLVPNMAPGRNNIAKKMSDGRFIVSRESLKVSPKAKTESLSGREGLISLTTRPESNV